MKQRRRHARQIAAPAVAAGPSSPEVGSWIVVLDTAGAEHGLARIINASAEAARATAAAFYERMVPPGSALRLTPEHRATAATRFEANATTLLPVLDSLRP
jgi:hypothetical protein